MKDWFLKYVHVLVLGVVALSVIAASGLFGYRLLQFAEFVDPPRPRIEDRPEISVLDVSVPKLTQEILKGRYVARSANPLFVTTPTIWDAGSRKTVRLADYVNRDGIPWLWAAQCGLNILSSTFSGEDPDGDGFTNLEEFAAQTFLARPTIIRLTPGSSAWLRSWKRAGN